MNFASDPYVTTREHEKRFCLLQPGSFPARIGDTFQQICGDDDIPEIFRDAMLSDILAVDFETKNSDYSIYGGPDEVQIIGVGLSYSIGSVYLHWATLSVHSRTTITELLKSHLNIIAHNVYFDEGVARACCDYGIRFRHCTYSMLAYLANEGHPDQYWGLKQAQVELLGWTDSNEHDLDEWLVSNGFYKGNRRLDSSKEYLQEEYKLGKLRPEKGEMWRAPTEILGKYCALDAEACYLLYTEVLLPVFHKFKGLQDVFQDNMNLIHQLVEQKFHGIPVDREGLLVRKQILLDSIGDAHNIFRNHPSVADHILDMESRMRDELLAKEPARLKIDGDVSKNWLKWEARLQAAKAGTVAEYNFNIQSGPQMRELLYTRLGLEVRARTESGEPAVGVKTLKHMGEIGEILINRAYDAKELSYIEDYIERTQFRSSIHPSFRTPGTMTGRLSSKEPNIQQIPKSKAVMSLFQARPGHIWIDLDFSALEPVVLTEFSQDENLLAIYGDTAPKNDIYLYVAASIPSYADAIRATGYDPLNPTPSSLARAKKECKSIRSICKTVVLACQYGAGVRKIMETLEQDNVFLSYQEVEEIHSGYWNLFAGVRDFSRSLEYEWRRNGGFILNGLGRPMAVPEGMLKDILNRFVQSTGHDILMKYVNLLTQALDRELPGSWKPLIIDWHDSAAIEVPFQFQETATRIMSRAVDTLNLELKGSIRLRGEPDSGIDLAGIKKPEE